MCYGMGRRGEKSGLCVNYLTGSKPAEQISLLRQPDRMGTCSAEPRQMFSPGCQPVPQDKVAHGAVAGFSDLFSLANHKQENRAYTGLSGEAVTLISCLLVLNKTLD